ncbi:hypothetical protein HKK58_05130 [Pseudomonas sp. ADAK22]|uniref:hypothetical protein n=1 Tax=Pseudomonas sp. ADAK22 TaxID=2730851 RepID=UPI001464A5E4|nr:hypothetical protein [Pseudomonas sp. ADAK22]QJI11937.1 hypothetical protein HKK58_05130 [Pseudomonas sp. ADAK22]
MQMIQRYMLTIHGLFTITDGDICGAETEVAILDEGVEIDRVKFSGNCQSNEGYNRAYTGKPCLTAGLVSGPGRIRFEAKEASLRLR